MNESFIIEILSNQLLLISIVVTAVISSLVTYIYFQRKVSQLREKNTELSTRIEIEQQNNNEKIQALEKARAQLSETFTALSSKALQNNNEEFLKLARENLKQYQSQAVNELDKKEKAIEHLLNPIKESLSKTEEQIRSIEKERKESYGALHKHLESMAQSQSTLQDETRKLVTALRRPEVRGQWGEMTLKRLAELAGMVEHCDFYEQEHVRTHDGALRPDMIVRMPDGREIVVDVKTPLDAYISAIEAVDDAQRLIHLKRHTQNVKQRINELADKAYWDQFKNAPDFVVLFIPGDQFLSAALDQEPAILENALSRQVILATPTSLVALLRAVGYGWRQEQLAENAEHIKTVGEELYGRLQTFTEHLQKVGRSLDTGLKHYNSAVGSFDSRVLPSARKFNEMGISADKKIIQPNQIETAVRQIESEKDDS
ncbi:MAG: DNA recombination protein RmuC [Gammaproteobacteria bacterium]|nr:DNA recombination protein RmuC [Gammaproteobacteria bacterium]MCW8986389.1 DNA recombination protein RmuC [Gammaproteobacteria bacterium]MCW9031056.1 DNA recombination protein RmuC [Gammaproteobacteria bacterium]